ncbi:MAG: ATP-binding cassette domain-containing protein [Acidimicrobiales bacterium]
MTTEGETGSPTPLLSVRGVSKNFGPVRAITRVDLDLPLGQVTALAGDNGAGKSVLVKTIAGLWEPNEGQLIWEGNPVHLHSPRDAEVLGITTIYQDLALCNNLDIVQNMYLGHELMRHWMLDEGAMETAARKVLTDLSVTTIRSIRQPVESLSGGQRQSVAVAKAVMSNAKLVMMDEPTAALGVAQTRMVLDLIRRLADHGVAVLVISHNLNDVFAVADRIAVLHLGRMVAVGAASEFDSQVVVDFMTTGRSSRATGADGTSPRDSAGQTSSPESS